MHMHIGNIFYARALALGHQSSQHTHWLMTDGRALAQSLSYRKGSEGGCTDAYEQDLKDTVNIMEHGVRQVMNMGMGVGHTHTNLTSSLHLVANVYGGSSSSDGDGDLVCVIPSQVLHTLLNNHTLNHTHCHTHTPLHEYIYNNLKPTSKSSGGDGYGIGMGKKQRYGWFRVLPSS